MTLCPRLQAARSGQILIDSDISEPEEGIEAGIHSLLACYLEPCAAPCRTSPSSLKVYVYKNAEANGDLARRGSRYHKQRGCAGKGRVGKDHPHSGLSG